MFKKQRITVAQYDRLTPEAKERYRDFYVSFLGNAAGPEMVNGVPLMNIGEAWTYLYYFSNSDKFYFEMEPLNGRPETKVGQFIDHLWNAVSKFLEKKNDASDLMKEF